jgi:hypothetical protein
MRRVSPEPAAARAMPATPQPTGRSEIVVATLTLEPRVRRAAAPLETPCLQVAWRCGPKRRGMPPASIVSGVYTVRRPRSASQATSSSRATPARDAAVKSGLRRTMLSVG